jgi:crossover junction endodeoxyribonuclease RusA
MSLTINVVGTPAPQGSKRAFVVNGRAVVTENSKRVKPWRQDVKAAALEALNGRPPITGPVELTITFWMPRPRYHFRTGARAHELKPNAPTYVGNRPDLSKLIRSTEDALTEAAVYHDDAQVARLVVEQRYATGVAGADIQVRTIDPTLDQEHR